MRESRLRKTAPGLTWSERERSSHDADCISFLKRKAADDGNCKKSKAAKRERDDEHLASWDHLCSRNHACEVWTKAGVEQFSSLTPVPDGQIPRSLFICMDWDQKQWRVVWFLRHHCRLNIEGFPDLTHRRQRDLTLGAQESHFDIIIQKGLVCVNAKFGPWGGCGFMKDVSETAKDLSENMSENDPVPTCWLKLMVSN